MHTEDVLCRHLYTEAESRQAVRLKLKEIVPNFSKEIQDALTGPKYAPIYLKELAIEDSASVEAMEKMQKAGQLLITEGRIDNPSVQADSNRQVTFKYSSGGVEKSSQPDIFVNCTHELANEQKQAVENSWLKRTLGQERVFAIGINTFFTPNHKFDLMDSEPQKPSIDKLSRKWAEVVAENIAKKLAARNSGNIQKRAI